MIVTRSFFSHAGIFKLFLILFVIKTNIDICNAECSLVHSTPKEKKLLERLKPLNGHTFEAKDNVTKYNYKIGICGRIKGQDDGVGAVQTGSSASYSLGRYDQVEIVGGNNWLFLTYYGGDNYNSHCNNSERVARIMITCVPNVFGKLQILEERNENVSNCFYLFELESNVSCTNLTLVEDFSNQLSFGSLFCILFFTFGSIYIILGFLYKRLVIGSKGVEQIPNYSFWRDFGNLQADGCDFICRCGPRQESQAYRGIDDHLKMEDERDDQLLNM